ncbi:MAG: hypothetical protein N3G19_00375 [Candidatus Pacearchaeota archaeon]|nr:hypothetical protein [Candidatus Pacearchaeota archaeon]
MIFKKANHKKAQLGHGISWLWKFIILTLVIGGVVAVVIIHYSRQLDVRPIEMAAVSRKLVECIAPRGIINETLEVKKIVACLPINEDEIYLNIALDDNPPIEIGKSFLSTLCEAKEKKVAIKTYPSCSETKYLVLNKKAELSTIKMFIAIRKTEKNL